MGEQCGSVAEDARTEKTAAMWKPQERFLEFGQLNRNELRAGTGLEIL